MPVCKIENGIVAQRWDDVSSLAELAAKYGLSGAEYVEADAYHGMLDNGDGTFSLPVRAARVPATITFAQLIIGLVEEGWITEAEGDAWRGGTLPAPVLALISTLPAAVGPVRPRFRARTKAERPSVIERSNDLVVGLGAAQGKTPQELDQFFITYSEV